MRSIVPLLVAVLVCLPAAAQPQKPSAFAGDDRLNQKVTVRWKKATLFEALAELKKKTGIALTPDRGVVDEPVMASATNVPVRSVLEHMGKLLKFTWARYGGTPEKPGYLLFKDKVAAAEEEAILGAGRRMVLEALQKEIDKYRRISRMSPEQLQAEVSRVDREFESAFSGGIASAASNSALGQKMQDGMALRTVASPHGRAMMDLLNGLSPGQWNQILDEQPVVFSTSPVPGEFELPDAIADRLRSSAPSMPFPKSLFRSLGNQVEEAITQAESRMQAEWSKGTGFKVNVQLSLNMGAQPLGMLRVAPEPTGLMEGIGPLFALTGMNLIGAPTAFPEQKEDPAEREKRLSADPVLGKKAKLELPPLEPQQGFLAILGQSHRMADILPAIEAGYGVPIVADAYNRLALSVVPPPTAELPLFKLLDQVGGMTRDWELDHGVIRFRSRTWAWDRRSEIPARLMQRWLAERKRKGVFNLDDLAEIAASLRDEQVENLMFSAMEAGANEFNDFTMISTNRDVLRFWGSLLPLQRRGLATGGQYPVRSLYPRQQEALLRLIRPKGSQSMMAAFMGSRPTRTPQMLTTGVVTLEVADLTQRARRQGEEQQPRAQAQVRVGVGGGGANSSVSFGEPVALYTLRLSYPDGQKDQWRIPTMRPTARPTRPQAPAPPVEKQ